MDLVYFFEIIALLGLVSILFAAFLLVIFGQVTVRRLRKKPATKDSLGMEIVSGSDIVGVAQTLSILRYWARKLDEKKSYL